MYVDYEGMKGSLASCVHSMKKILYKGKQVTCPYCKVLGGFLSVSDLYISSLHRNSRMMLAAVLHA